jgi:hyaluronan synthase
VHTHEPGDGQNARPGGEHRPANTRYVPPDDYPTLPLGSVEATGPTAASAATRPTAGDPGNPRAAAIEEKSRHGPGYRYDQHRLSRGNGSVHGDGQTPVPAQETIPGALNDRYDIPAVTFSRKRTRGLTLTCLFIGGIAAWRLLSGLPVLLILCSLPAFGARIISWVLSWFDKPVTVTAKEADRLDRLHVTIAVPCFNEDAPLLDRCLYALINQTRPAQLIWMVDDGSAVDYSEVQRYWERTWPGGTEIRWTRQSNQGKRRAHAVVFGGVPETDVFVTVDSDTTLTFNALEEGLKPFVERRVLSVAGIEHGYNAEVNFLTRLQCCLQLFSQAVTGASWAVFGDMYTNRGPFALYRSTLIRKILPLYRDEHFFGRRVILGDDSLLALAGSTYGKSVQQLTAFGLTMWPENIDHHIRQRVRWARGRAMRNFWRIRYRPFTSYCWWYTISGIYVFLTSIGLIALLCTHWPQDRHAVGHALIGLVGMSILISPRVLCIRKSSETWVDRLLLIVIRPFAGVWASVVLARGVRIWGTMTILKQGWTTRQDGPELVLETVPSAETARVAEEAVV